MGLGARFGVCERTEGGGGEAAVASRRPGSSAQKLSGNGRQRGFLGVPTRREGNRWPVCQRGVIARRWSTLQKLLAFYPAQCRNVWWKPAPGNSRNFGNDAWRISILLPFSWIRCIGEEWRSWWRWGWIFKARSRFWGFGKEPLRTLKWPKRCWPIWSNAV